MGFLTFWRVPWGVPVSRRGPCLSESGKFPTHTCDVLFRESQIGQEASSTKPITFLGAGGDVLQTPISTKNSAVRPPQFDEEVQPLTEITHPELPPLPPLIYTINAVFFAISGMRGSLLLFFSSSLFLLFAVLFAVLHISIGFYLFTTSCLLVIFHFRKIDQQWYPK